MIRRPEEKDKKKQSPPTAHAKAFDRFNRQILKTVFNSIKMASAVLTDPLSSPLAIFHELQMLGQDAFLWKPETLMAAIDSKVYLWTSDQVAEALNHFHDTGEIKTNVPPLVRQKIYAIRTIVTSDTPHIEWNIFEKVGSVFNDRVANFSVVEPLSPGECARTIALIEAIRPDAYSNEIKAYIAASCHEDGMYTISPSKYLNMAEEHLAMMNREGAFRATSPDLVEKISMKLETIRAEASKIMEITDDFVLIQAIKLFAIDKTGDDAVEV